jgi:ATP-dependent DNA helicase HFM1/MER3
LKLKHEFEFSDDEEMEVIDLAQDFPKTSYSDLAPRDYRKLHNLHSSIQENNKNIRLMTQKPQYQYGSGNPPQLPFAPSTKSTDDLSEETEYPDDNFPSPSALFPRSRDDRTKTSASYRVDQSSNDVDVEHSSPSGISRKEDASDPFEQETVFFSEQYSASSFDNSSLNSLEAGMLDLGEELAEPIPVAESPKLNYSFVDGVFDFEAFNNSKDSQGSHLSLSAYQPAGLQPPTTKHPQHPMKRLRSPSPEEEVVKCRRVTKDHNTMQTPQGALEPPKPVYPEWLNEFDADLIDEFKDVVDFVD